jgi:hypothetical protein
MARSMLSPLPVALALWRAASAEETIMRELK